MEVWTKDKRQAFEAAFYDFLGCVFINSKDTGAHTCLGDQVYEAQRRFITAVLDGLEAGIHDFYVLKSRQLGLCYDPSMRVLKADLTWAHVGDIRPGDELVACQEEPRGGSGAGRKMVTATVEATNDVFEPAFELEMDDGRKVIATGEHRHLCKVRGAVHTEWRAVKNTLVGDKIRSVTKPWDNERTYEDGWFGGMLDGEGSMGLPSRSGAYVNVSQVQGPVLERARKYLIDNGYEYRVEIDKRDPGAGSKLGSKEVHKLSVARMAELFRLMGKTRPTRFIGRRWWEGKELPGKKLGSPDTFATVRGVRYVGQRRMIDIQTSAKTFICEGLVSHNSTISRAFTTFYLGVHDGLDGATVWDTDVNKNAARREIEMMVSNLPPSLEFPRIKSNNRDGLFLNNQSGLRFMSAGVKKSKASGTLGRSTGLSFAHCSEMCSWDAEEGLEAFKNALSEVNPDRLYIWESTARGFNLWHEMWESARADVNHSRCIFLGWYLKPSQVIKRNDPDFERYGVTPPTEKELKRIQQVRDQYDWNITPEQLAWIRRKMDPNAKAEGDADPEYEGSSLKIQEQPWTEEEAFQMTGSVFFAPEDLTRIANDHASKKFQTYSFMAGTSFLESRILKAPNARSVELKIWDEPDNDGVYIVASDPSFGINETNDRSAIQVMRCYADGMDQVAEYAWPLINTRAFAWMIAAILGYYAGERAEVYNILELNGPGDATWQELQSLKRQLNIGYMPNVDEKGIRNVFANVRNYIYNRTDSMGTGHVWQLKTNGPLKVSMMERLRDFTSNGMLHIRSMDTLEEMKAVTREGDSIEAQGSKKDDRVMALAMAVRCWEERVRRGLMTQKRTRQSEMTRKRLTVVDQYQLYSQHISQQTLEFARQRRVKAVAAARRFAWRSR